MCRYGEHRYKEHYACFACRKAWKPLGASTASARPATTTCPDCGGPTAAMGLDFAPPKRRDEKAWSTVAALYEVGITFHSCGCSGPGYRPRAPGELAAFYRTQLDRYRDSLKEAEARVRGGSTHPDSVEAVPYWRGRIALLEQALAQLR